MSTDLTPGRDALRAKIEASERRMAERTLADSAAEAASVATEYVKQNPLTVLAGAIAVGLVIGAASKPGRRAAKSAATGAASAVGGAASNAAKGAGTAVKKRGSAFGGLIADALIAYGLKVIDDALDGSRDQQRDTRASGAGATAKARGLRREASLATGKASDRASRVVRELTDRIIN